MDILKSVHMACAAVSISGFVVRGVWMIIGSALLKNKWVKIIPHCVDTVLLVSAIALAIRLEEYPLRHAWLTVKVLGVLAYIFLGMEALRLGRTQRQKILAWVFAIMVFAYIAAVAFTRNPMVVL